MSASDLFACQADAFIMSLISFKFTCSLCSASEWLAAVWDVLHTPSVSRLWNVFSVLLYISFNRFSKKVKCSGSLAHFSIAQSAWWTDSVESKFTVTEEDPLALNILQILKNIHYYNTKVWLSCWTEFEYPGNTERLNIPVCTQQSSTSVQFMQCHMFFSFWMFFMVFHIFIITTSTSTWKMFLFMLVKHPAWDYNIICLWLLFCLIPFTRGLSNGCSWWYFTSWLNKKRLIFLVLTVFALYIWYRNKLAISHRTDLQSGPLQLKNKLNPKPN